MTKRRWRRRVVWGLVAVVVAPILGADGHFAKTPAQLSWSQASMLAGLVQAPSAYDPMIHLSAVRLRQRHVLNRLVATGVLSAAQADAAFAAPLGLR